MRWVTDLWGNSKEGYNTRRSAFWRVIRGVVERLAIADVEQKTWPSHLLWSNLYKVAPEKGGNPGGALCKVQLPGCIELFRSELTTYKPSRLLLLTGTQWATPFLSETDKSLQKRPGFQYAEDFGTITLNGGHQLRYVVAAHPQRKPEAQWIEEVVEAYDR